MPIITNNSFSSDTHSTRSERLNAIQGNFATVQTFLNAPAHIETWAEDCFDVYTTLLSDSGVEANESQAATLDAFDKEALMELEYQNCKILATSIYRDDQVHLKDFGFDTAFPSARNDKIARVKMVLETNTRHLAIPLTTLIPAAVITRLEDALDDYVTALQNQDKERAEAHHAVAEVSRKFESDLGMLQELKAWWYAMMGKNDERISYIGMVNPSAGGSNPALPAPVNFAWSVNTYNFTWDAVPGATSYQIEESTDGTTWIEIWADTMNTANFHPATTGTFFYRCRARNANGFGAFCTPIEIFYYSELPAPANLEITINPLAPTEIRVMWDTVQTAGWYNLYQSEVNSGDPLGSWSFVGQQTSLPVVLTGTVGKRYYYRVQAANEMQLGLFTAEEYVEVV